MNLREKGKALDLLHSEIDHCFICKEVVQPLKKPIGLKRGDPGAIVVIGEGPGNAELKQAKAFAGPSGVNLDKWFIECGANSADPRRGIYFTSIVKCVKNRSQDLVLMKHNCRRFLDKQLAILEPSLVITLGSHAYESLKFEDKSFDEAIGKKYFTGQHFLFSPYGFDFSLIVWPHPSPISRWLNDAKNKQRLKDSFQLVRPFIDSIDPK